MMCTSVITRCRRIAVVSVAALLLLSPLSFGESNQNCKDRILSYRQEADFKKVGEISEECCEKYQDGYSCNQLGFVIEAGVFKSTKSPLSLYRLSCDYGYFGGCKNIAAHYKRKGDYQNAKDYYRKACELKDPDSCVEEILIDK